jgi:SAM-dependent methyltransferase
MAVERLYQHPQDYELEVASQHVHDTPFWRRLVRRERPARMLEIGCGAGRLTIPLAREGARHGFVVTGLDSEAAMLDRAREHAQVEPEAVQRALRFMQGDARVLALEDRFDVILMPYGVAHHFVTREDQLAAWGNTRRHLAPGGLFAVDVTAPDLVLLACAQDGIPRAPDLDVWGEDGRHLRRSVAKRYDAATQRLTMDFEYEVTEPDGTRRAYPSTFVMYVYYPQELRLLCESAGFHVERLLGAYSSAPFAYHSRQLIALARPMTNNCPEEPYV